MFLGLRMHDDVPDARTIWLFRETPRQAGAVEQLFARFDGMLNAHGLKASGGQIIDAAFVEAPRQRNSRDDNAAIKDGGDQGRQSAKGLDRQEESAQGCRCAMDEEKQRIPLRLQKPREC